MTDPEITWVYGDRAPHRIIKRLGTKPCYNHVPDVDAFCQSRDCIATFPQILFMPVSWKC